MSHSTRREKGGREEERGKVGTDKEEERDKNGNDGGQSRRKKDTKPSGMHCKYLSIYLSIYLYMYVYIYTLITNTYYHGNKYVSVLPIST